MPIKPLTAERPRYAPAVTLNLTTGAAAATASTVTLAQRNLLNDADRAQYYAAKIRRTTRKKGGSQRASLAKPSSSSYDRLKFAVPEGVADHELKAEATFRIRGQGLGDPLSPSINPLFTAYDRESFDDASSSPASTVSNDSNPPLPDEITKALALTRTASSLQGSIDFAALAPAKRDALNQNYVQVTRYQLSCIMDAVFVREAQVFINALPNIELALTNLKSLAAQTITDPKHQEGCENLHNALAMIEMLLTAKLQYLNPHNESLKAMGPPDALKREKHVAEVETALAEAVCYAWHALNGLTMPSVTAAHWTKLNKYLTILGDKTQVLCKQLPPLSTLTMEAKSKLTPAPAVSRFSTRPEGSKVHTVLNIDNPMSHKHMDDTELTGNTLLMWQGVTKSLADAVKQAERAREDKAYRVFPSTKDAKHAFVTPTKTARTHEHEAALTPPALGASKSVTQAGTEATDVPLLPPHPLQLDPKAAKDLAQKKAAEKAKRESSISCINIFLLLLLGATTALVGGTNLLPRQPYSNRLRQNDGEDLESFGDVSAAISTLSPSASATATASVSATASITPSPTGSATASITQSLTESGSITGSPSTSASLTNSETTSETNTPTVSMTSSDTASPTPTATSSPTPTTSPSATASACPEHNNGKGSVNIGIGGTAGAIREIVLNGGAEISPLPTGCAEVATGKISCTNSPSLDIRTPLFSICGGYAVRDTIGGVCAQLTFGTINPGNCTVPSFNDFRRLWSESEDAPLNYATDSIEEQKDAKSLETRTSPEAKQALAFSVASTAPEKTSAAAFPDVKA